MILTHPGLRLLARRKFRGFFRAQARRVKSVKGALLAIAGFLAIGTWLMLLFFSQFLSKRPVDPSFSVSDEHLEPFTRLICAVLTLTSVLSAFGIRGLYLPREEIELLFSAPVTRSDVVRYRLLSNTLRSLFGGMILGLMAMKGFANPWFGFVGAFLGAQTLPVVSQAASLLAGDAENRVFRRIPKWAFRFVSVIGGVVVGLIVVALLGRSALPFLRKTNFAATLDSVLNEPALDWATRAFTPWARAMSATSFAEFLPWIALCVALWAILFELVARIPIDYRELSLETSADIAKRINRMRKGRGGASAATASRAAAGWRVPWLFGRTPTGSIAWRKSASIFRKARGTFITSGLILGSVTVGFTLLAHDKGEAAVLSSGATVAALGTLYLCMGLRFDFRDDLEQMEIIKSWPVQPWRIFVATLLPEVLLVSALVVGALLIRSAILGSFDPRLLAVFAAHPVLTFTWLSIDNAVFLFAPVKFVPGQEGMLQNAGRAVLMMLLRFAVILCVGAAIALCVGAVFLAKFLFGFEETVTLGLSVAAGTVGVLAVDAALIVIGGELLRRFDVSRDRG